MFPPVGVAAISPVPNGGEEGVLLVGAEAHQEVHLSGRRAVPLEKPRAPQRRRPRTECEGGCGVGLAGER